MPNLKTIFAGSPAFAATILGALAKSKYAPIAVYTQPDRPAGRGRKVRANPVKQLAESLMLPVFQPASLRNDVAVEAMTKLAPDVLIVAAYGLILPAEILAVPTYGCINVHASLLPRWRGAAPIERAMMSGDKTTGVCIMKMEAGLDTGPLYHSSAIPIDKETSAEALEKRMARIGAEDLRKVLDQLNSAHKGKGSLPIPTPQDDTQATYANKLTAADRLINWQHTAEQIARQIMALGSRLPVRVTINDCGVQLIAARSVEQPMPGDEHVAAGTLLDVSKSGLLVQCATDLLQITALKVERGKGKVLDPAAAANGFKDIFYPGARLV